MIQEVVTYLDVQLDGTGFFQTLYGAAYQIERDGKLLPAVFRPKNELLHINLAPGNGIGYHRVAGPEAWVSAPEIERNTGCEDAMVQTWPMVFVYAIPRSKFSLQCNSQYLPYWLAHQIQTVMYKEQVPQVEAVLKADTVTVGGFSAVTDPRTVWQSEYTGHPFKVPDSIILGMVKYTATIIGNPACFLQFDCHGVVTEE
jgi:hypothetical protein